MRKSMSLLVLVLVLIASSGMAQMQQTPYQRVNQNDVVAVGLMNLVLSDLQLCGQSLRDASFMDNVSALGHLNNALSALKATRLDRAYDPLVNEILTRIGKIKFYLVMQDFSAVSMRLSQLNGVIRSVLFGDNSALNSGYNNGYNQGHPYQPQGSGFGQTFPRETPVGGSSQFNPIGLPTGIRPPNN